MTPQERADRLIRERTLQPDEIAAEIREAVLEEREACSARLREIAEDLRDRASMTELPDLERRMKQRAVGLIEGADEIDKRGAP